MLWSSSPTAKIASCSRPGEHLQPGVLQAVGVLELVDQDVPEAPLVVLAQRGVVAHQLVGAQHQLGEVDHAFALALRFVGLVDPTSRGFARRAPRCPSARRPSSLLRRWTRSPASAVALLVEVHRLDDALDGGELVLRVEDLEALRQAGEFQCARRKRLHRPWKVPIHMPRTGIGSMRRAASASPWRPCW